MRATVGRATNRSSLVHGSLRLPALPAERGSLCQWPPPSLVPHHDSPGCRRCGLERPISGNSEHEAAEATRSDAYHIVETAATSIKQTVGYLL